MPRKQKHEEVVEEEEEEEEDLEDLEADELPKVEPYKVLDIEKTATIDEIKLAYRKAALKNHPGTNITFHVSLLN
jgi:DnaJ-class molecular chaperone